MGKLLIINGADFSSVAVEVVTPSIDKIKITVAANNTTMGTCSGGGYYDEGDSVTISATPNTGYRFVGWSDGNTNATRTITVGSVDATYTATFEEIGAEWYNSIPNSIGLSTLQMNANAIGCFPPSAAQSVPVNKVRIYVNPEGQNDFTKTMYIGTMAIGESISSAAQISATFSNPTLVSKNGNMYYEISLSSTQYFDGSKVIVLVVSSGSEYSVPMSYAQSAGEGLYTAYRAKGGALAALSGTYVAMQFGYE